MSTFKSLQFEWGAVLFHHTWLGTSMWTNHWLIVGPYQTIRSAELSQNGPILRIWRTCEYQASFNSDGVIIWIAYWSICGRQLEDNQITGTLPEWSTMWKLNYLWVISVPFKSDGDLHHAELYVSWMVPKWGITYRLAGAWVTIVFTELSQDGTIRQDCVTCEYSQ